MKRSKRTRNLLVLLGILAVACVLTLVVVRYEEHKEKIKNSDEIILDIDPESVTSLSWEYDDTSLSFTKGDTWTWDGDEAFPVSEDKMNELLGIFKEFGAAFAIEEVEDLSQYGLDAPTCKIKFTAGEQEYEVDLGAYSTMDSQRYVSIGDGKVYLVKTDPFESYEVTIEDMVKNDEIPALEQITALSFEGLDNYTVTYETESSSAISSDDVYFTDRDGEKVPLDTTRVNDYCSNIASLSLSGYATYQVTDEELEAWGLKDPAFTASITYTPDEDGAEAQTFTIHFGQNREELAAKEAAEAKGEEYTEEVTCYARVGESGLVYPISETDYENLTEGTFNDLRHQKVMFADSDSINEIDVTLEGASYQITNGEEDDAGLTYEYNGEKVDLASVNSALNSLTVTEFVDETPSDKEEISLTFHLDNENYPETTVQLYRYDGASCVAVVDGKTLGLVNRSAVVELVEAINTIILG